MFKLKQILQKLAQDIYAAIRQWAIADWNHTVEDYHAGIDWLCGKLKAALRTVD